MKFKLRRIKQLLARLKPNVLKKNLLIWFSLRKKSGLIIKELKKLNYKCIKRCSLSSWKNYKEGIRVTFSARKDKKKVILKITDGFVEKMINSINFHKKFNEIFDFIPKAIPIKFGNYIGIEMEFISSYSFSDAWSLYRDKVPFLVKEITHILDKMDEFKVVHCDLESVNVLVEKKTLKLFLIDFDTCNSADGSLFCDKFPWQAISYITEKGLRAFDDAYSFSILLKRYGFDSFNEATLLKNIDKRIGRNVFIFG